MPKRKESRVGAIVCLIASMLLPSASGAAETRHDAAREAVPVAARWGGFYLGGEFGAAWASYNWNQSNPNYFNTLGTVLLGNEFDQTKAGINGGVLGGYVHPVGPVLLGVELAATGGDLTQQQPSPFFPNTDVYKSQIYWMASATARVGYAWQRWQFFAKGGWAGADLGLTMTDTSAGVTASRQTWVNGWTAGVGAEYMVFNGISVGIAYDYTDFQLGDVGTDCPQCGTGVGLGSPVVNSHIRLQSVMARVAFHFGP